LSADNNKRIFSEIVQRMTEFGEESDEIENENDVTNDADDRS